jgi:hypothetical protein
VRQSRYIAASRPYRRTLSLSAQGVFMSAQQYDPNKLGWGAAIVTVAMTAALGFGAYTIHNNTYRHPRDPMAQQVYFERDQAKHSGAAEHGPAAGGEHGAADAEHKEAAPAAGGAAAPAAEKH